MKGHENDKMTRTEMRVCHTLMSCPAARVELADLLCVCKSSINKAVASLLRLGEGEDDGNE